MNRKMNNYQLLLEAAVKHTPEMFHEPAGCLKHPFLAPGGPYSKTLWDWDSFWAATALLGIAEITGDRQFQEKVLYYAAGSLSNLFDHQAYDGSIPILLSDTAPDWFDSTKNPANNMAKPMLGQFCLLLDKYNYLKADECLAKLEKFYTCYRQRYLDDQTGLYLWANDIAIGVDDDPATWGRPPFSSASIFLNSFLYEDLKSAAQLAQKYRNKKRHEYFKQSADALKDALQKYCRDDKDGLYYSVDIQCRQNLSSNRHFGTLNKNLQPFWKCLPLKVASWSSFIPLWSELPNSEFADKMVKWHLTERKKFWTDYGIRSLAADEKMYSPEASRGNPSNWLGPVWIISNYIVWKGLVKYGYQDIAEKLADNTINLLAEDYRQNSFFHENYSPETGKGVAGSGFWNWNLLVCLMS